MTIQNKAIVRKLNHAFEADDSGTILSLLTDDIRWEVVGAFTAHGKSEYADQTHNENFPGPPTITIINEIAEGDFVAVEGRVENQMKNGSLFRAYFHNTYFLENEKIKSMKSFVVPVDLFQSEFQVSE